MSEIEVIQTGERAPVTLFGLPLQRIVIALVSVVALGIYIGVLLFGPNSLTVLLSLEERRAAYETCIKILKDQNAALQKEYFELKQLGPES